MTKQEIFNKISAERDYQDSKWGTTFDDRNTANDWVTYMTLYLGKAVTYPWDKETFQKNLLKVAALAVAALERSEYPPRHYDK